MPTVIDNILESIKQFQAENASMGADDDGQGFPAGIKTSHATCVKNYREALKPLIKLWKAKVAQLKAAKDPNPEYNAAKAMKMSFLNAQSSYLKCLLGPKPKESFPNMSNPTK